MLKVIRRSTFAWVIGLAFCAAVYSAKYMPGFNMNWLAVTPVLLLISYKYKGLVSLASVVALVCLIGLARSSIWSSSISRVEALVGAPVLVTGRVVTDTVYDDRGQTEFDIDNITINGVPEKGKLRIKAYGQPAIFRHDTVTATGKLKSGFGTRVGALSFATVEVTGRSASPIEAFRRKFGAALYSSLGEEQASLALGILVGQRTSISEENDNNLRTIGLTHIIAVSGYNLTVLVRLSRRGLKGLSKFQGTLLSVLLVVLFLLLAGNSASIVRAAWVVGLSLAAGYYGRQIRPLVLLLVSAAATVWFDPHYIWYDLGWWLSFTAFYGVLLLSPVLTRRLYKARTPGFFGQIAVESFAASLLTMPLILWAFGRVSIVSIFSNMVVVPTIPLVMLGSFAVGLAYMASGLNVVTKTVTAFTGLLLSGILLFAKYLSKLPFAESTFSLQAYQMLIIYALVVASTVVLHVKTKHDYKYDILA